MILLWHASGSGEGDAVLQSILAGGFKKSYCHPYKNMQTPGIFFTASKPWAVTYAERLQNPRHLYHRPGKPFVVAVGYLPSEGWDIDYELGHIPALNFLKQFDLKKFPAEKLRVTVRKKHMPKLHPNPAPGEGEHILVDWVLTSVSVKDTGPELHFRNLLNAASQPKISLGWNGDVAGAQPQSGSLACVMEQLTHFYRDQNPEAFREFIAANVGDNLALKYTGDAPLPVVAAEIKNGDKWEVFKA